MAYLSSSEYNKFQSCDCGSETCSTCSSSCGCCPPGTVEVKDSKGCHVGCLYPADAAEYYVDTIAVPEGFVKVNNPNTGEYVGLLSVSDYCSYLTCVGSGADTFSLASPRDSTTGSFTTLSYNAVDGSNLTGDIVFWVDRNGYTGVITLEIVSTDGILFLSGGSTITIPAEGSLTNDEFEGPALATGNYSITLNWKKADGTVVRSQAITFIVP